MRRAGRRRSSSVWDCFKQVGNYVRCMKCNATLKYCGGATSTMMHHMNKHMPFTKPIDIDEEEEDEEKPVISVEPIDEESSSSHNMAQALLTSPQPSTERGNDSSERKRLKRSSVWDVFIKQGDEVHCTICDTKLKYRSSTTSMIYHIKNKHSEALPAHTEVNEIDHLQDDREGHAPR